MRMYYCRIGGDGGAAPEGEAGHGLSTWPPPMMCSFTEEKEEGAGEAHT